MSDKKLTQLQTLVTMSGDALLYVVDNPDTTPVSKQISFSYLFGNLNFPLVTTSDITVGGDLSVSGTFTITGAANLLATTVTSLTINSDGFVVSNKLTPESSDVPVLPVGKIFFDEDFLYIKVNSSTIKRVALQSF